MDNNLKHNIVLHFLFLLHIDNFMYILYIIYYCLYNNCLSYLILYNYRHIIFNTYIYLVIKLYIIIYINNININQFHYNKIIYYSLSIFQITNLFNKILYN